MASRGIQVTIMRYSLIISLFLVGLRWNGGFLQTCASSIGKWLNVEIDKRSSDEDVKMAAPEAGWGSVTGVSTNNCQSEAYDTQDVDSLVCSDNQLCSSQEHGGNHCGCDAECAYYGDCCYDAPSQSSSQPHPEATRDQICQSVGNGKGYFMTSTCPTGFPDRDIRSLCEDPNPEEILLSMPATYTNDSTLFRNLFCAICNGKEIGNLYFWKLHVDCKGSDTSPLDDDPSFSFSAVVGDASECADRGDDGEPDDGISSSSSNDGTLDATEDGCKDKSDPIEAFETVLAQLEDPLCSSEFQFRLEGINKIPYRLCTPIDVNHFSVNGDRADCPPYVSPYISGTTTYRNRECAACNGANVSLVPCEASSSIGYKKVGFDSYSNLFLFRGGYVFEIDGKKWETLSSCGIDEIFDPYSGYCRPVVAKREPITMTDLDNSFIVTGEAFLQTTSTLCVTPNDEHCLRTKELISSSVVSLIAEAVAEFQGSLDILVMNCVKGDDIPFCQSYTETFPSNRCEFEGILITESPNIVHEFLERDDPSPVINDTNRRVGCDSPSVKINIQDFWLTSGNISCESPKVSPHAPSVGFLWREEKMHTEFVSIEGSCLQSCETDIVEVPVSEFSFNGTHMFHKDWNQHFGQGSYYQLQSGSIGLCAVFPDSEKPQMKDLEDILTIIGASLSITGLAATAFTYIIFSRLRNNMGKSILSLVLALLVAQVFQVALFTKTENKGFCTFVAIVAHYTYLATFFWTNVLAFDLSRTFGNRSKMQTVRDSKKVFFYFSCYAWGCPMVIVAICSGIHFSSLENVAFSYGNENICWLGNFLGLLLAFGVPVTLILLLNVIFFIDTVVGIMRARNETKRATASNPSILNRDRKKDFLLFCKLSVIMGLTWTFGILNGTFPQIAAIRYIFIVLNSTQGVFIFIAFGCNPRVIEMWKTSYSKRKLPSTRSNSLAVTAKSSVSSVASQQIRQVRVPREIKNPTFVP